MKNAKGKFLWTITVALLTWGAYYLIPILFRHGSSSAFEIGVASSFVLLGSWYWLYVVWADK